MQKSRIIHFLIILSLILLVFVVPSRASYCIIHEFNTDKDLYYSNEEITITVNWTNDYDSNWEISYIQIRLFNSDTDLLWNSSKYYDNGTLLKMWTLNITSLHQNITEEGIFLTLKFYYFYFHFSGSPGISTYLKSKQIEIQQFTEAADSGDGEEDQGDDDDDDDSRIPELDAMPEYTLFPLISILILGIFLIFRSTTKKTPINR